MGKLTVLITGASGGIGLELAQLFARDGHDLILTARSVDALQKLAEELERNGRSRVHVMAADLSDPKAPDDLYNRLSAAGLHVDVLVNNAGFGMYGPFAEADAADTMNMVQVNVNALTRLTRLFLPAMTARGSGRILNVASTAAFQPGPLMAVYFATKGYVLSFSEAIAYELEGTGVTVTVLCPGPTRTGFEARAKMKESKLFKRRVMDASAVAQEGYKALMKGTSLVIPGIDNKLMAGSVRFMPRKLVPPLVKRVQGKVEG